MKSYLYRNKEEASNAAESLGCEGFHTVRKKTFKPCNSKKDFKDALSKMQGELDELIDFDGTMVSSKIPILDPQVSPKKTMDQTVASTRQTQDPLTRGYRVYYGESLNREIDMSKAFGWDETQDTFDFEKVVSSLEDLLGDKDDAIDRAEEFGYQEDKDEIILKEKKYSIDEVNKMVEDLIIQKSDDDKELNLDNPINDIIKRNIKSLMNLARIENISVDKLVQMIKNE